MKRFHILGGGPKQMRQGKRGVLPWRVDQTLRAVKLAGTNKYVYTMLWENYTTIPSPAKLKDAPRFDVDISNGKTSIILVKLRAVTFGQ